jgi:predicted RNase H-like HicB family nuclease
VVSASCGGQRACRAPRSRAVVRDAETGLSSWLVAGTGAHAYEPSRAESWQQGEDIDDAVENAQEALALYVEGLRKEGRPVGSGIVRRRLAVPA